MKADLIQRMEDSAVRFSKGQKRIAAYIAEHYDEAAFMTALKLGEQVSVSESTVVRFATELGFDGYPQLQKAMQDLVRSRLTSIQRIEVTRARMEYRQVLDTILAYDTANIRQTLDELSADIFYDAVEAIVQARRVYIFGAGSCRAMAQFAAYYLKLLLPDVQLIHTSSEAEIFEEMLHISADDALLVFSMPRYSSKAVKTTHFANNRGAKVVAITDGELSPIAEYATHLLTAHSDMPSIVDSLVAPLSVLNALIVAISWQKLDEDRPMLAQLEKLWEDYQVYQSTPTVPREEK